MRRSILFSRNVKIHFPQIIRNIYKPSKFRFANEIEGESNNDLGKKPKDKIYKKRMNADDSEIDGLELQNHPKTSKFDKKLSALLNSPSELSSDILYSPDLLQLRNHFSTKDTLSKITKRKNKFQIQGELLYGFHPVLLAFKAKRRTLYKLYIKNNLVNDHIKIAEEFARQSNIPVQKVSKQILDEMSYQRPHQGFCLDAEKINPISLEQENCSQFQVAGETNPLSLFLYEIQDPMNFGAILRSAYYFGIDRIFISKINSCPLTPIVSKASAGALELVDVFAVENPISFLKRMKSSGYELIGSTGPSQKLQYSISRVDEHSLKEPALLILGNEGKGLTPEIYSLCSAMLTIPPYRTDSLHIGCMNVAVATGILLHSLLQKYK